MKTKYKLNLLWNSLIFHLYKNRLTINTEEIEEQLKIIQAKEELKEYLISEIVFNPMDRDNPEPEIAELLNKIKMEGFENIAMSFSISETAARNWKFRMGQ